MNKALIVVASESDRRLMSGLLTRAGYEPIAVDKGMDYYDEFEQYQYASEPDPKERAGIWQTAIGLQKVDGLNVSDFLVETAKRHIEGEIDIDTVQQLVSGYYQSAQSRERSENDMEADTASMVDQAYQGQTVTILGTVNTNIVESLKDGKVEFTPDHQIKVFAPILVFN